MKLPVWLRQLLTEDDANSIICPVRVIGASGAVALIADATFVAIKHGSFDAAGFGTGLAAIAASVGVGAGLKAHFGG